MNKPILLKNGLVLHNGVLLKKDILIKNNLITQIADSLSIDNCNIFDVSKCWVIPGAIDIHAHFREPGFTDKETILTGSRSAAKGGITTAMAMPNLNPAPDDIEKLKIQTDIIERDSVIRIYPYATVTKCEAGKELSDIKNLSKKVKAFSDDGRCINDLKLLKKAMLMAKTKDIIIASHAEASGYGETIKAEYIAVEREIELLRETGSKYHFCHISTERSFKAIENAQLNGIDVSCEVTPHHLFLCDADINNDTNFKMNPTLRSASDMQYTIDALLNGVATIVATDHAPHTEIEKNVDYKKAPNGIIGFETMLPLLYTQLIKTKKATYKDMLDWVVYNPAKRFNIPCSKIEVGSVADISVLDIETPQTYTRDEILSKSKNSPFIGWELYGMNILTVVGGKVVYKNCNRFGGQNE